MSNPFQLQQKPAARRPAIRTPRASNRRSVWFGTLAAVATILLLAWFIGQAGWLPGPLRGVLMADAQDKVYADTPGLSQTQARQLYRQALGQLEDNRFDEALSNFKKLEPVYPGLTAMLWLHEAEGYAGQGNEWAVQKKLRTLMEQHGASPLTPVALYRIGQSQFRGSEWEKARETFERVRRDYPNSTYATGSLYYLGTLLAKEDGTRAQAIAPLKEYLAQCADCKFSGDAADLLETLLASPTPREHAWIGLAYAASAKDTAKTLAHLRQGTFSETWLALGKAQLQAGQKAAGVQTLIRGLPHAQTMDHIQDAVDRIAANSPNAKAQLIALQQQRLPLGGDYVLWKAAQLDSANASTYYQHLLNQYPKSDYAPESSWSLLWPALANGQTQTYLTQARQYMTQYPYARSAPKVLFWMAKLQEKSHPTNAIQAYQQLIQQYPSNYYAFRGQARLDLLTRGQADPGWPTLRSRAYPPAGTDLNQLNILPPASMFGQGPAGEQRRQVARELQAIGAAEDVRLWVTEATGKLPAAVDSWAYQAAGDRAKGLRVIRDALDEQVRQSFEASGGKTIQPAGTHDELKLLYPVYFSAPIAQASQRQGLDPFLIQALMREESYFNEFAISSSNARGLMQLLPSTAREVAGWEQLANFQTSDLFLPEINVRLGSRYLAHLHELFNGNAMPSVGAYNGGPNAMKRWVQASPYFKNDPDMFVERIPYEQSRDYIKKVFGSYWNYQRLYGHPSR